MDKLRALRYFKQVAEVNSFSLAAIEFNVPASSISRRIKDLESDLGVELIKRTTRHVSTTELGCVYYDLITDALQKIDDADELISQRADAMEGKLRISSTASFGEKVLAPILRKFRQQYPSINLDIDFSDDRVSLSKDSVDIAIRAGHVPEERVIAKKISSSDFKLVATPKLLDCLKERYGCSVLSIENIENCPTLQYRGLQGLLSWWVYRDESWKTINITPVLRCNSGESLLEAVLSGEGMALYPEWWIEDYLASGELIEAPVECPISCTKGASLDVFILYQQAKYQIPKVKKCVDFILEHLNKTE